MQSILSQIDTECPVLIAGPTAGGKSALALAIAEQRGGVVINADASQVYGCWREITARPSKQEEARAPHALYGHIAYDMAYSVGHWLSDLEPLLHGARPIIVGGTGLYFTALTEGLSDIPPVPIDVRERANTLSLNDLLDDLDVYTTTNLDTANRARVQRAWEVQTATGRSIRDWQSRKSQPLVNLDGSHAFVLNAPKEWLTPRIERRFDQMIDRGALEEIDAMGQRYDPDLPSCRAIGVPELMAYKTGDIDLETAKTRACIATRQFAKRQRTWFKARFSQWTQLSAEDL